LALFDDDENLPQNLESHINRIYPGSKITEKEDGLYYKIPVNDDYENHVILNFILVCLENK
jgi:hypothetical protein